MLLWKMVDFLNFTRPFTWLNSDSGFGLPVVGTAEVSVQKAQLGFPEFSHRIPSSEKKNPEVSV